LALRFSSVPDHDLAAFPTRRSSDLLSSDGVVARAVIGPESDLDKEYLVEVAGQVTETKLTRLRHGLELDGRRLKPARVTPIEPRSEEHTSELQSREKLVCRRLLEKK